MRIVFISCISILIIVVLFWTRPDNHAKLQALPPPAITVQEVGLMDIQPMTEVTGRLQPARKANLHFQVSGQLNQRLVEVGQYLESNSLLLTIEAGDFADAVEESQALLKAEQDAIQRDSKLLELMASERELQERALDRLQRLGGNALASKSDYDQALQILYRQVAEETRLQYSVDSARSRLMIKQTQLNKARRNLQRTKLISPFAGTVNRIYAEVGDYVSPGQAALEIVQVKQLDLNLEITGESALVLNLGQKIMVKTDDGERQGEIISLAVDPDPKTNTHSLRIRIPSAGLFAGQLAVAQLPGRFYNKVTVVPESAVLYEEGESFVFSVGGDRVYRKPITLIEHYQDFHLVEGIASGTMIVNKDIASLAEGQIVSIDH